MDQLPDTVDIGNGILAPRSDLTSARTLPRPATLNVDLGIALGADSGQYGNLLWELGGQGFKQSAINPSRLEKKIGDVTVPLDFLAGHPVYITGTAQVESITANLMPGWTLPRACSGPPRHNNLIRVAHLS